MAEDHHRLQHWLVSELRVPGLSDDVDLSYIWRGDLISVWSYLTENVKSKANAQHIKKTLRLHHAMSPRELGDGADDPLEEKRRLYKKLLQQVQQRNSECDKFEAQIKVQNSTLSSLSQTGKVKSKEQRELKVKCCLLSQHREVMSHQLSVLNRFQSNLQTIINTHQQHGRSSDSSNQFAQLKKLRKSIAQFLHQLLEGRISKHLLQKEKNGIKRSLAEIMCTLGPAEIVRFIIHDVTRGTEMISDNTKQIDYIRDAEALRFKVVSDGLVDESDDPSLESGVSQLIEHRQLEHQQRFLQTESHRTKAKSLYSEQEGLRKSMTDRLHMVIQPKDSRLRIIREILEKKVSEEQTKAALETVTEINKTLREQVEESESRISKLKQKHRMIAGFRSDVHSKQNQICVLMKQNTDSKLKLDERQSLLISTINTLVSNAEPLASLSQSSVSDNYTEETRQLQTIPLYTLSSHPHTILSGIPTNTGKASDNLREITRLLHYRPHLSSDVLMRDIIHKHVDILSSYTKVPAIVDSQQSQQLISNIENLLPQSKSVTHNLLHDTDACWCLVSFPSPFGELARNLVAFDRRHHQKWLKPTVDRSDVLPTLKRSKELSLKGLERCDRIDSVIDHWWRQPGLRLNLDNPQQ